MTASRDSSPEPFDIAAEHVEAEEALFTTDLEEGEVPTISLPISLTHVQIDTSTRNHEKIHPSRHALIRTRQPIYTHLPPTSITSTAVFMAPLSRPSRVQNVLVRLPPAFSSSTASGGVGNDGDGGEEGREIREAKRPCYRMLKPSPNTAHTQIDTQQQPPARGSTAPTLQEKKEEVSIHTATQALHRTLTSIQRGLPEGVRGRVLPHSLRDGAGAGTVAVAAAGSKKQQKKKAKEENDSGRLSTLVLLGAAVGVVICCVVDIEGEGEGEQEPKPEEIWALPWESLVALAVKHIPG